jgi:SWIM zinc finger
MCSTRKTARKQREITRHLTIVQPFVNGVGQICITETTDGVPDVKDYTVTRLVTDFGIGLEWLNPEGATYHVNLNGEHSTCDCPWGTYRSHLKPCRHVSASLAFQASGKLDVPAHVEEPAAVPAHVEEPHESVCLLCGQAPVSAGLWTLCFACAGSKLSA